MYRYRCIQRNQKPESWQGAHARSARSARSIHSQGSDEGDSDSDDGMVESGWTAEEIAELDTKQAEGLASAEAFQAEIQAQKDLKASAKAKLIAGEALTEDEANTIVL